MKPFHAVIWSVFYDAYIIKPLSQVSPVLELKCIGTRDECNAWIAKVTQ